MKYIVITLILVFIITGCNSGMSTSQSVSNSNTAPPVVVKTTVEEDKRKEEELKRKKEEEEAALAKKKADEESKSKKYIPGIESSDIKLNLEKFIKMKFTGPKNISSEDVDRGNAIDSDTGVEMDAQIYGSLPLHVRSITFTTTGTKQSSVDATSTYYFKYIATLPYDGADQESAKKWVEENVKKATKSGDIKETTIGDVRYELVGTPLSRILTISKIDSNAKGEITDAEKEALKRLGK